MKNSIGIIMISIIIVIYEFKSLKESDSKKEVWSFSILLLFATILGIMKVLDINIPNPLDLVSIIYSPINNILH
ncbi:hypothetical protein [Senegalia massiliensis]|uniref:Uncharacterized protein n=1 Tax=Senegalia massiliensis TaxID=1720316 RepID=A0A845R038_9CLOT|nr:hypothetical protein [Senegalia massiliensis]NBI05963.1 hypothetical protein [Senegalia massiliensis]